MDGFALDSLTQLVPQGALRDQVHAASGQVFQEEFQTHVVAEGRGPKNFSRMGEASQCLVSFT